MKRFFLLFSLTMTLLLGACNLPAAPRTTPGPNQTPPAIATLPGEGDPFATQPATTPPAPTQPAVTQAPLPLEGEQFGQQLAQAVEARDMPTLRAMMGERFAFGTWNTGLNVVSADEAIDELEKGPFAPGAQPAVRWGTDIPGLLGGTDPLSLWGPVDQTVRAMHVMGLGSDASKEAVLVIGRLPDGRYTFHGILQSPEGYFHEIPANVLPTDVQYVMAREAINLRSGPGTDFAVVGQIFEGQTVKVSGKSVDEAWWWVQCEQDASGFCWLSADPELTEPTTAP